jgi:lysophospholipase L1-like esterase
MKYTIFASILLFSAASAFAQTDSDIPPAPSISDVPVIGVVGDSISDEYATYPYGLFETNWVQQLESTGKGELGDFQSLRFYPRLYGYEYNWARAGATSRDVIREAQVLGLVSQIESGDVEAAVVLVGANDFGAAYDEIYNGEWDALQINEFLNGLESNMRTIIEAIKAANPVILIVATIPDIGDTPAVFDSENPNPDAQAAVDAVVQNANQRIRTIAGANSAIILDVYSIFKQITEQSEYRYLGYRLDTDSGGVSPRNLFANDDFHPGTLIQSYLANSVLTLIEHEWVRIQLSRSALPAGGESIQPDYQLMTKQEIFGEAGVDPLPEIFFESADFAEPTEVIMRADWFGLFSVESFPWIVHETHGWLFCDGYGDAPLRFWDSVHGYMTTTPESYPTFIREVDAHILTYEVGSSNPRRFFDETDQIWLEVAPSSVPQG